MSEGSDVAPGDLVRRDIESVVAQRGERSLQRALSEYVDYSMRSETARERATSCCFLETRIAIASGLCSAAKDWALRY